MQLLFSVHSRRKRNKRQGMLRTPKDHFHPSRRNSRQLQRSFIKTNPHIFLGYCFACSNFGHKAMNCRAYERKSLKVKNYNLKDNQTVHQVKRRTYNSFAPLQERNLECFNCHNYGHKSSNLRLMEILERLKDIREKKKLWKERTLKEKCLTTLKTQR